MKVGDGCHLADRSLAKEGGRCPGHEVELKRPTVGIRRGRQRLAPLRRPANTTLLVGQPNAASRKALTCAFALRWPPHSSNDEDIAVHDACPRSHRIVARRLPNRLRLADGAMYNATT